MIKFTFHKITQLHYFSTQTQQSRNNIAINNKITLKSLHIFLGDEGSSFCPEGISSWGIKSQITVFYSHLELFSSCGFDTN